MKKLFTLLFAVGAVSIASAQSLASNARPSFDDKKFEQSRSVSNGGGYGAAMTARDRDYQIQKINREFDARIFSVKRDRYMRNAEKNREIRFLEKQRAEEIRQVNIRYANSNKGYGRNDGRNDDRNDRRKW